MLASNQVEDDRQDDAENQAGGDWNPDRPAFALDENVTGETAKESHAVEEEHDDTEDDDENPGTDEDASPRCEW